MIKTEIKHCFASIFTYCSLVCCASLLFTACSDNEEPAVETEGNGIPRYVVPLLPMRRRTVPPPYWETFLLT